MTADYQPGPYAYDNTKACFRIVADDCGTVLARVSSDIVMQEGTARLLAAAPDLLEALREVVDCNDRSAPPAGWLAAVNRCRAAIAKVEG